MGVVSRSVFAAACLLGTTLVVRAEIRAVIVGVHNYPSYPPTEQLLYSHLDADTVGKYLRSKSSGNTRGIVSLTDKDATRSSVLLNLKKTILNAHPGDDVWIFFSARGVGPPGELGDGYIGTHILVENKAESNGIAVSELREMIRNTAADRVVILADLCRDPLPPGFDNRINNRMEELGRLPKVTGYIATAGDRPSFETNPRQRGVFSFALLDALSQFRGKPGGQDGIQAFYQLLKQQSAQEVSKGKKQIPQPLGKPAPLWTGFLPVRGPLLAALEVPAGLLAQATRTRLLEDVDRLSPDSVVARVSALRGRLPQLAWEDLRDDAASRLATVGDRLIAEYGVADLLPDDPYRPGSKQRPFEPGARALRAARALLPNSGIYTDYQKELERGEYLCSGLDQIYRSADTHDRRKYAIAARSDLLHAKAVSPKRMAEIENALGISYLEEGNEYAKAILQFKEAKRLSPLWPYPRHNLALAYGESGDYAAAEREYQAARVFAPEHAYLSFNLGLLYERSNRRTDAKREYEAALASLKEEAEMFRQREKEWAVSLPDDSVAARVRAGLATKAQAIVENAMGSLYASERRYTAAAKAYDRALGIDNGLCAARHNLALLKQKAGNRLKDARKAVAILEENARICPAFHPSLIELAYLRLFEGDLRDAKARFDAAEIQAPNHRDLRKGRALLAVRERRFGPALAALGEFVAQGDAEALEASGDAHAGLGDGRACEAYRRAVSALKGGGRYRGDANRLLAKSRGCHTPG